MQPRQVNVLAIIAVMACGCDWYNKPAADSFAVIQAQLKSGETLVPIQGATVTLTFFQEAGVQPLVGRFFIEGDQRSSPPRVVLLSHDLWTERFAASSSVVGHTIEVDGHPVTIVGVAPRGFRFPTGTQLWMPMPQSTIGAK
jgi:hypothetical protein